MMFKYFLQNVKTYPDQLIYAWLDDHAKVQQVLTYQRLYKRILNIGHYLKTELKLLPGDRALLVYLPSLDFVEAFLACLWIGVIPVPIAPPDPSKAHTSPLVKAIAENCQTTIILTHSIYKTAMTLKTISMSLQHFFVKPTNKDFSLAWHTTDKLKNTKCLPFDPYIPPIADEIAFLQYTSGSTSAPKGVMITYTNIEHQMKVNAEMLGLNNESRSVLWVPHFHDFCLISGIISALYGNGQLYLFSPQTFIATPSVWFEALHRYKATHTAAPNFAYELSLNKISKAQIAKWNLSALKVMMSAAEPIQAATVDKFLQAFALAKLNPHAFCPAYGLAEHTVGVTMFGRTRITVEKNLLEKMHRIVESQPLASPATLSQTLTFISCGKPVSDIDLKIVDVKTHQICEEGKVGEIWVDSPSKAKGYWGLSSTDNNNNNSQDNFKGKLLSQPHRNYLCTGDLGFLHKGELFITGRLKELMIVNGRNLYPQDLEQTIKTSHDLIKPGRIMVISISLMDEGYASEQIVALFELRKKTNKSIYTEIVAAVRKAILQQHQVACYAILIMPEKTIEKTTSGKLQRHKFRQLLSHADKRKDFFAKAYYCDISKQPLSETSLQELPQTDLEKQLTSIWETILGYSPASLSDDFLHQGGNSVTLTLLQSRIKQTFHIALPIEELFQRTTLRELISYVESVQSKEATSFVLPSKSEIIPVSYNQQRLWLLQQLINYPAAYHVPIFLRLQGQLNIEALQKAFQTLSSRHASLRTGICEKEGHLQQIILPQLVVAFPIEDLQASLANLSITEQANYLENKLIQEAEQPFTFSDPPLWRVKLFQISSVEFVLALVMHHIITDGWSISLMGQELGTLYNHYAFGQLLELEPLSVDYDDYARWQRNHLTPQQLKPALDYWRKQLDNIPPILNLPTDYPRLKGASYHGHTYRFVLSEQISRHLQQFSLNQQVTVFMTLLVSLQLLLYRYTGEKVITIGTPVANRPFNDLEKVIGFFVNTLALKAEITGESTVANVLQQAKKVTLSAYEHQAVPFELVVNELKRERHHLDDSPLFQVMLICQNYAPAQLALPAIQAQRILLNNGSAQFDLTFIVEPLSEGGMEISIEYANDLFNSSTIQRMAGHWQVLLQAMLDPQIQVKNLPLLTEVEKQQLLVNWNQTGINYHNSQDKTLPVLFESQVQITPNKIAVLFNNQTLTYRQLNEKANQLAHYLREQGIQSDQLVAISLDPGIDLIISLWAVLKAGGAYVPLDPLYPPNRLQYMLNDTRAPILITHSIYLDRFNTYSGHKIAIDKQQGLLEQKPLDNLTRINQASDLAYVLYTSGSTGNPKGVMIPHSALVNALISFGGLLELTDADCLLNATSIGFDIAALELFMPLLWGAQVCIAATAEREDTQLLMTLLASRHITLFQATPSRYRMLLEYGWKPSIHLKLLCGGEALPSDLLQQLTIDNRALYHFYGPTETTIWSTFIKLTSESHVTLGHPISNTSLYVLDPDFQPVPVGIMGELYIGGLGVARGYLNNPLLTQTRFVLNPFAQESDKALGRNTILYRTGDRVRYLPNGTLEYLGRIDFQIKLRGFRIEPSEIETAIKQQAEIKNVVVVLREDPSQPKLLVAYLVLTSSDIGFKHFANDLKNRLQQQLPDYMIPQMFMRLNALPLNQNGKLDRHALPMPTHNDVISLQDFAAPKNAIEQKLAIIWSTLLNIEVSHISRDHNFFQLGGNSLLIVQLFNHIKQKWNVAISLKQITAAPTLQGLARVIQAISPDPLLSLLPNNIVLLQKEGHQPPLFLIHPLRGEVGMYMRLSPFISDRPLYGISYPMSENNEPVNFGTMEQLCDYYLRGIKQIQPTGPYYIGGWCFGGVAAIAIAQKLREQGERNVHIIVIDSYNNYAFLNTQPSDVINQFIETFTQKRVKALNLLPDSPVAKLIKLGNQLAVSFKPTYKGEIVLIKATYQKLTVELPEFTDYFISQKTNGWEALKISQLIPIEVDHYDLFDEFSVAVTATALRTALSFFENQKGYTCTSELTARFGLLPPPSPVLEQDNNNSLHSTLNYSP